MDLKSRLERLEELANRHLTRKAAGIDTLPSDCDAAGRLILPDDLSPEALETWRIVQAMDETVPACG